RQYSKAIDEFNASLELKGPAGKILERRAEAKFMLGDHVGAKLDVQSALEKDPKNPSPYEELGSMRLRSRDYEQAVRDLNQALAASAGAGAYMERGLAYGGLGDYKAAVADLKRAVE